MNDARDRSHGRSASPAADPADAQRLLHELQLHQLELELQNEELQRARAEAEASLARYAELYDAAPVGYLTLGADGVVQQANLAAARLLGRPREQLVGTLFAESIERFDRPALALFLQQLQQAQASAEPASCELTLDSRGGEPLRFVRFEGRASDAGLRVTLSNVTDQRLSSQALQRSETQLRRAYRQLAEAQEQERMRLTEQLHDHVGRNLTALGLNLSILDEALGGRIEPPLRERLGDSIQLLQSTVGQIRGLMSELYPPMLVDLGLFAALRWWAGEVARRSGIAVGMVDGEPGLRQPVDIESALFRIAQEALANAVRHARASRIDVSLRRHGSGLLLEITDDGCGFDAGAVLSDEERSRWGLTLMRERAAAIGGVLRIHSAAGRGTRVSIETEEARR